jgi:hypothetical protein
MQPMAEWLSDAARRASREKARIRRSSLACFPGNLSSVYFGAASEQLEGFAQATVTVHRSEQYANLVSRQEQLCT